MACKSIAHQGKLSEQTRSSISIFSGLIFFSSSSSFSRCFEKSVSMLACTSFAFLRGTLEAEEEEADEELDDDEEEEEAADEEDEDKASSSLAASSRTSSLSACRFIAMLPASLSN
jgi:hypothetical protein